MDILEGKIHDYRQDLSKEGVVLVVRRNNKYGAATAGERVLVDEREVSSTTMKSTCMPETEYQQLLLERETRVKEAPPVPAVKAAVDEMLAQIEAQAERKRNTDERNARLLAEETAAAARSEAAPPALDPSLPEIPKKKKR